MSLVILTRILGTLYAFGVIALLLRLAAISTVDQNVEKKSLTAVFLWPLYIMTTKGRDILKQITKGE